MYCSALGDHWLAATMRVVCAVGAESTGKTTLCQYLAQRFGVPWLPEYARDYLIAGRPYDDNDVAAIAKGQMCREAELLAGANGQAVLDTDLAVIVIWWRERFGPLPEWIESAFAAQSPRLYLLCRPDIEWQFDPLRESPGDRWRLHELYQRLLADRQLPFVEVAGVGEVRQTGAAEVVREWFAGCAQPAAGCD